MKLTSSAFSHHQPIPTVYTCDGSDTSPPLEIVDVPAGAKSLVLIMEDPDVPQEVRADGLWDHWIIFNIPPDTASVQEGYEPPGRHGLGTSGNTTYHGPCPPDGQHRYFWRLAALDCLLAVPEGCSKQQVEQAMTGHVLDTAELIGLYKRKQI